jgi:hypothetical protein
MDPRGAGWRDERGAAALFAGAVVTALRIQTDIT